MKAHWTERSNEDFLYSIVADFIGQLEKKMEKDKLSQAKLAKKLRVSKGRVSQVLNNPGNVSLLTVIKYARSIGMKISIVAYEDDDPKNAKGPINSEIFTTCWEKFKKPSDIWEMETAATNELHIRHIEILGGMEFESAIQMAADTTGGVPMALDMWTKKDNRLPF